MEPVKEHEYVRTWYFCQLKIEEELQDYNCEDADGFPDCTTCEYQIKTNKEIAENFAEVKEWNDNLWRMKHES